MDREKLMKMASAVRTGGKGSVRRKKKAVHKMTTTDDKGLQSTLKRIGVNAIPAIEEVNIFKDDIVIQFLNPKVQASIVANTWVVSGAPQTKKRAVAVIMSTKTTSSRISRLDALEKKLAELEERQRALEKRAELEERLRALEASQKRRGSSHAEDLRRIVTILESLSSRVSILETKIGGSSIESSDEGRLEELETQLTEMQASISEIAEEYRGAVSVLRERLKVVDTRTNLHACTLATQSGAVPISEYSRLKVPEPKYYGGYPDATKLEKFLFDIEQYFRAIGADSDDVKVTMVSKYLCGKAKLWWRVKYQENQDEHCKIDRWEDLKQELKNKFLPGHMAYFVRKQLRGLTQTGTIHEYVKKFSGLMLDIRDMTEQDRLFYFMEGLQPWARNELQLQKVRDLPSAQVAAEQLSDYSGDSSQSKRPLPMSGGNDNGNKKPRNWGFNKGGGAIKRAEPNFLTKPTTFSGGEAGKKPLACWLYNDPHRTIKCPEKMRLSVTTAQDKSQEALKSNQETEETDHMVALRMLNALKKQSEDKKVAGNDLLFVD